MKAWEHFKTITHHRHLVMKGCFAVGLYKQGLLHDLSKYSPVEFLVGAKYYQGDKSPNNAEREDKGVSLAWLHHKGRNKHHFEYWIDYALDGKSGMAGMKMPVNYVVEMYCDRVAACKTYQKDGLLISKVSRSDNAVELTRVHDDGSKASSDTILDTLTNSDESVNASTATDDNAGTVRTIEFSKLSTDLKAKPAFTTSGLVLSDSTISLEIYK